MEETHEDESKAHAGDDAAPEHKQPRDKPADAASSEKRVSSLTSTLGTRALWCVWWIDIEGADACDGRCFVFKGSRAGGLRRTYCRFRYVCATAQVYVYVQHVTLFFVL